MEKQHLRYSRRVSPCTEVLIDKTFKIRLNIIHHYPTLLACPCRVILEMGIYLARQRA